MTGEMSYISENGKDINGDIWYIHAAIAEALNGKLRPFDKYQGPYIVVDNKKLWIVDINREEIAVYCEDTDTLSFPFYPNEIEEAIEAAKSLI